MNGDTLYTFYNGHVGPIDDLQVGHDIYGARYSAQTSSQEINNAPPLALQQEPAPEFLATPVTPSNENMKTSLLPSPLAAFNPFETFQEEGQVPFQSDPFLSDDPISPTGLVESTQQNIYNSDELVSFPIISTDLSLEKKRPAPLNLSELYPTPDERYLNNALVSNELSQYTTSTQPAYHHGSIHGNFSSPTSPLHSPSSYVHPASTSSSSSSIATITTAVVAHLNTPQSIRPIVQVQTNSGRVRHSLSQDASFSPKSPYKLAKFRARSVPNIGGLHTTQPGPIPASKPTLNYDSSTGEELLTFSYSRHRIITTFTIKCPTTRIVPSELPEDFLKENCVYPRAMVPVEEYKGNRGRYERECNEIGWKLAWSNPEIRNHRGLVQRAVDSWRNTRTDKTMRSRRVRKTEVKN